MSHPFEFLLRGAREAGFAKGLQAGRRAVEEKLIDLQNYVRQLEDQLHREGNWRVAKVTKPLPNRTDDLDEIRQQRVNTQQVRHNIPAHPVHAVYGVIACAPAPVPSRMHLERSKGNAAQQLNRSNPWGSISRRRGRHFRSRVHTSQSDFHLQNTNRTRYIIPPLRPVTDFVSSSLSFPARLFSRFWDRDEGVATREGGTWVSGLRVPGILSGVRGPGSV
jgi:hypothetical protein